MNKTYKKIVYLFVVFLFLILLGYIFCYYRWYPIWQPVAQRTSYSVEQKHDDTLRIIMIGDSWTGLHHECGYDSVLHKMLQDKTDCPVIMEARGKGGAKSGDIYEMMFRESGLNPEVCTQPLIESSPNYAIVTAGINDAASNMGTDYYCHNYLHILRYLLKCGIRPVVVEMPDVNIKGIYSDKPLKDRLVDRLRSWMTVVSLYDVKPYRDALYEKLIQENLMDSIIYISLSQWQTSFGADGIHLDDAGYRQLDSCLTVTIIPHHKQMIDSAFFKNPVSSDAQY